MINNLNSELLKAISQIDIEELIDSEKQDLLTLFNNTLDHGLRNEIAMIFSHTNYNTAIPFIITKINEKETYGHNGTLVFALESLDVLNYFVDIIKIICNQGYEARYMAFEIIAKLSKLISEPIKLESLQILDYYLLKENPLNDDDYLNSTPHFINETKRLLTGNYD